MPRQSKALTKSGTPRKRVPGGGRKPTDRNMTGPRVSFQTHVAICTVAKANEVQNPEALEAIVMTNHNMPAIAEYIQKGKRKP